MPLTITSITPGTLARGESGSFAVVGTGFPADIALVARVNRGACLIGGHTLGLNPTLAVGSGVETARSTVDAPQIDDISEGLSEAVMAQHNAAGIAVCYCIRFPDPLDSALDDPPLVGESRYDAPLAALIALLNAPGSELQASIAAGRFMLGFFNEASGGPGSFRASTLVESAARQVRGLALATGWVASIRSAVTNGNLIRWCSPGLTSAEIIAPSWTAQSENQAWRQSMMREWIEWAQDMAALYGTGRFFVDVHLNCSGLAEGAQPLRPRVEAVFDYAASIGYGLEWLSNEFGPARVRIEGEIPVDAVGLAQVAEIERAMWHYAFARDPYHLQRNPFPELPTSGGGWVAYSVVESDQTTAKEPFATLVTGLLAATSYTDTTIVAGAITNVTSTSFDVDLHAMGFAAEGLRDVYVSYFLVSIFEATLADGLDITTRADWEPEPRRTYDVVGEDRVCSVPAEDRGFEIPAEDRVCVVAREVRRHSVAAESRTVEA